MQYKIKITGADVIKLTLTIKVDIFFHNEKITHMLNKLVYFVNQCESEKTFDESKIYILFCTEYELYIINDVIQKSSYFSIDERMDFQGYYNLHIKKKRNKIRGF